MFIFGSYARGDAKKGSDLDFRIDKGKMNTDTKDLITYYKQKYPLTFDQRFSKEDQSLSKRYEVAWKVAKTAAEILKQNYYAQKVMAFGSLTNPNSFTYWSDIDLAVLEEYQMKCFMRL